VGKLVVAFVFFLAASALAIHEAKPSPPRDPDAAPAPARVTPAPVAPATPGPVIRDQAPPWVKYATPAPAPATRPITRVITIEPTTIEIESGDDIPDVVDRCPDQPDDRDDNDGCPEPDRAQLEDRIILID
jgi:hypothetical protein